MRRRRRAREGTAPRFGRARTALGAALAVAGLAAEFSGARAEIAPVDSAGITLEQAVELALTRNERARSAEAEARAAEARVAKARSFFFPDLTLGGSYTRRAYTSNRQDANGIIAIQKRDAFLGSATLGLALFDARSIPLYRQAAHERDAAHYSAADSKRLLAFEAANAFLTTLGLQQVAAAADQRLEFARKSLADARARFEAQLVGSNDVTKAELEAATAERERALASGDARSSVLHLGYLLDHPIAGRLANPESLFTLASASAGDSASLSREAHRRRLDLAASRSHALALHSFAREPLLRYIPSFGLTSQTRISNERAFSTHSSDWFTSVNLLWPLYDGGERGADRAERLALARVADLDALSRDREIDVDVGTALTALQSQQAALRTAEVAAESARQNSTETAELYRQGLARALEVADSNVRLFEAQVALSRERYGLVMAYLSLRDAVGLDPMGKEPKP